MVSEPRMISVVRTMCLICNSHPLELASIVNTRMGVLILQHWDVLEAKFPVVCTVQGLGRVEGFFCIISLFVVRLSVVSARRTTRGGFARRRDDDEKICCRESIVRGGTSGINNSVRQDLVIVVSKFSKS